MTTAFRPHWLSCGFRPFFLLGSLAMAGPMLVWLAMLSGLLDLPTAFAPRDWHIHMMLFGAVPAVGAGFSLTAVSNWTGRPPVAGGTLFALAALWLAGRTAVSVSTWIGPVTAAAVDLGFFLALCGVLGREVLLARNYRNLRVVGVIGLLGLADAWFHYEAIHSGLAEEAARAGIAVVLVLLMLVGGRIVPAFTRNWLAARNSPSLPLPFSRYDGACMTVSVIALALWTGWPAASTSAAALVLAGVLNLARLARWQGMRTRSEPLLAVLHIGFATIPLGFLMVGASIWLPMIVDPVAAVHVWTAGSFGTMILAVMTRASLGHSGRPLRAGRLELSLYALVLAGAAARVAAPYTDGLFQTLLDLAGLAWVAAFLGFAIGYAGMLVAAPRGSAGAAA